MQSVLLDSRRDGFARPSAIFANPRVTRSAPYEGSGRSEILNHAAFSEAEREIVSWPGYAPTPLRALTGLARAIGVREIHYKDEAGRFGLGSFKALGGAYAVLRLLQRVTQERTGVVPGSHDLAEGRYRNTTSPITVVCATDGNHGRAVAWGARTFGCRCAIYVHETVSQGRADAIAAYGAEIRRVAGNYDDAVRAAAKDAEREGWHVVSDTSYEGYTDIPRDVMQGYALMVSEALSQLRYRAKPTHVFVQGGVGGLAAAVCSHLWQEFGSQRPCLIVVEPDRADCLYRSAVAGFPTAVQGALDTVMAGLACGEVSLLAWRILDAGADAFMTIGDEAAEAAMRLLAAGTRGDVPLVAGESGVAGVAGLLAAASSEARSMLGLGNESITLVFGTEGATDPEIYARIVGQQAEDVARSADRSPA